MLRGHFIFSPIAHTHPIAQFGLPKGWDFWEKFDREFLDASSAMMVLMLDGWTQSKGVQAEIEIMLAAGKRVDYLKADTLEVAWSGHPLKTPAPTT